MVSPSEENFFSPHAIVRNFATERIRFATTTTTTTTTKAVKAQKGYKRRLEKNAFSVILVSNLGVVKTSSYTFLGMP